MDDSYLPPPGQLLTDLITVGVFLILGLFVWVIAAGYWKRLDQWLWKRRRERWAREARQRGE